MRQRLVIRSLIVAMVFSAGCSRLPRTTIGDEMRACVSWAGTTHLVAESWIKGAVPRDYAQKTVRAAQQRIERAIEAAEIARRRDVCEALYPLQYSTAKVAVAVDQDDWKSANKELRWLIEAKQKLIILRQNSPGTK